MIAIGEAAGIADLPHIRPYTAIQLKPHLGQICDAVRRAAASPPSDLAAAVDEIVHEWQDVAANERVARKGAAFGIGEGTEIGSEQAVARPFG